MRFDGGHGAVGVIRHGVSRPEEMRARLEAFLDAHDRIVLVLDIDGRLGTAEDREPLQRFMSDHHATLALRLAGVAVVMPSPRARAAYQRRHDESESPAPWPAVAVATFDDALAWARARLSHPAPSTTRD